MEHPCGSSFLHAFVHTRYRGDSQLRTGCICWVHRDSHWLVLGLGAGEIRWTPDC